MAAHKGDARPLYVILNGSMVPARSPEFEELERIKATGEFLEIDEPTSRLPRDRDIRVCGASRWMGVHRQYMELLRLGYWVSVHERGAYGLDYDGA
jgi:hypothetical protein